MVVIGKMQKNARKFRQKAGKCCELTECHLFILSFCFALFSIPKFVYLVASQSKKINTEVTAIAYHHESQIGMDYDIGGKKRILNKRTTIV